MWTYINPVRLISAEDYVQEIERINKDSFPAKTLIFCYKWFTSDASIGKLRSFLPDCRIYDDIEENPSLSSLQKAVLVNVEYQPDHIIAIGGGSVIDTAKVVRIALYRNSRNVLDLFPPAKKVRNKPYFTAVPTTHGTGSEVTMWATVWDNENRKKYSLSDPENYPDTAIYDVALLQSLPLSVAIISTLDALSHAFEALWNKNDNPVSDSYAYKAIELIFYNLAGLHENTDIGIREKLLLASMYAGLAFSNTRTAAAHSISYPLSMLYNIPHGIACSITLYPLLRINQVRIPGKIAQVLQLTKMKSIAAFWEKINHMVSDKMPFQLQEYGIREDDLNRLAEISFTRERMDNNIVELDKDDVLRILKAVF